MSYTYGQARRWADRFVQRQRRQLANLLSVPLDAVRLTDTAADRAGVDVVVGSLRVGLRVRRSSATAFGFQPTFRLSPGGGGRSELMKISTGELDYMLLNYATDTASTDDTDDDTITATLLLDLAPFRRAAATGFKAVQTHDLAGDRSRAVAVDIASLVAAHGPCLVAVDVPTTVETTTTTTDPFTGQVTTTTTRATVPLRQVDPDLLAAARRRAAAVLADGE